MATVSAVKVSEDFVNLKHKSDTLTGDNLTAEEINESHFVAVKGAPEVMRHMFAELPDNYDRVYRLFAINGSRVIAIGWKLTKESVAERQSVECDLQFAGFLVFRCPLKPDTARAIKELHDSMHRVIL